MSGVGKKYKLPALIDQFIGEQHSFDIRRTNYPGHAVEIADKEKGVFEAIVAVGGDGTVNEIARVLAGTECPLGIVPAGSGNGLARHLKIPLNTKSALERIAAFQPQRFDTGAVNDHFFASTCGFGFDAHIAKEFDQYSNRGFLNYVKLIASKYGKYGSMKYTVEIGAERIERTALLCAIANSSQFGNGFTISPNSTMQDGTMELIFISKFPWVDTPIIGAQFFTRKIANSKHFESFSFKDEIKVRVHSNSPIHYHLDGEPRENENDFKIVVKPKNLLIL